MRSLQTHVDEFSDVDGRLDCDLTFLLAICVDQLVNAAAVVLIQKLKQGGSLRRRHRRSTDVRRADGNCVQNRRKFQFSVHIAYRQPAQLKSCHTK